MIYNPVLGAIAGDMIGVPYEFLRVPRTSIPRNFPLWKDDSHYSDDTVMTLAVAKWLLEGDLSSKALVKYMQELGQAHPNAGYGGMFRRWLTDKNPAPYESWGNGSAMRVSPIGCAFNVESDVWKYAKIQADVSHNHPEGEKGAQAVAFAIWAARNKWNKDAIKVTLQERTLYDLERTPQDIKDAGYTFRVSCQESVPEAICCFLHSTSYEDTVREAILLKGDTDTQAAMAGSIAAAFYGIPKEIAAEAEDRLPDDLFDILYDFSKNYNLDV